MNISAYMYMYMHIYMRIYIYIQEQLFSTTDTLTRASTV